MAALSPPSLGDGEASHEVARSDGGRCVGPEEKSVRQVTHPRSARGGVRGRIPECAALLRGKDNTGFGHHSPAALIAMIFLCCGGITVDLPKGR